MNIPGQSLRSDHIVGIDLLRFVAAFMVVLFHYGSFGRLQPEQYAALPDRAFPMLDGWTQYGWVGVQFFFVLSGYVIALSARGGDWKAFLTKRALRILPALWICASVALLVRVAVSGQIWDRLADWARSVVLLPKGPYIDGVIWTLVVEVVFYATVATVLFAFKSQKDTNRLLDRLALCLGTLSAAFVLTRLALQIAGAPQAQILTGFKWTVVLLNHGMLFALGMLLRPFGTESFAAPRTLAIAGFGLAGMAQITLETQNATGSIIANTLFILSVLGLLGSITYNAHLARLSGLLPFRTLGNMSYPLYLGHFAVSMALIPALFTAVPHQTTLLCLCLALVLGYAWAVSALAEPALRGTLRQILRPAAKTVANRAP